MPNEITGWYRVVSKIARLFTVQYLDLKMSVSVYRITIEIAFKSENYKATIWVISIYLKIVEVIFFGEIICRSWLQIVTIKFGYENFTISYSFLKWNLKCWTLAEHVGYYKGIWTYSNDTTSVVYDCTYKIACNIIKKWIGYFICHGLYRLHTKSSCNLCIVKCTYGEIQRGRYS